MISIIVPFRSDEGARAANWAWLKLWWWERFPRAEIVEGASPEGEWCKGAAVADAVSRARGDKFVVVDADLMPNPGSIEGALAAVRDWRWIVPHETVVRLTGPRTEHLTSTGDLDLTPPYARGLYRGYPGGGCVVLTRKAWDRAPMDQRFIGWGDEDTSWGHALDTIVGPHLRLPGDLVHLWHPAQPTKSSPPNRALGEEYQRARWAPRVMAALVANEDPGTPTDCPPVVFECDRPSAMFRPGCGRVRFRDGRFETTNPDLADQLRHVDGVREVCP